MDWLLTDEQRALQRRVRRFAAERLAPIAATADEVNDVVWEVVDLLKGEGLFSLFFPTEYGGSVREVQAVPICLVREELARVCAQADVTFVLQGLGSYPILIGARPEQKARYLPPLARGEKLAAFALTEPDAGSDVAGMHTTATWDGDFYILNGAKRFISNAPAAATYSVFAKTDPTKGTKGISAFVVEKGTPGFDFGPQLRLLAPHCIGQPLFHNCRVPKENLLGEPGEGFKIAMRTLDLFRTSVGAAAVGLAQAALEEALKYARTRIAFGQALVVFQATQFKLADMATEIDAARLLVYRAALLKDRGAPRVTKESSMAKLFATEAAWRVVDQAVQIHGGNGVNKDYPVERLYRQVRSMRIYEGTSEIHRLVIANQLLKEADSS